VGIHLLHTQGGRVVAYTLLHTQGGRVVEYTLLYAPGRQGGKVYPVIYPGRQGGEVYLVYIYPTIPWWCTSLVYIPYYTLPGTPLCLTVTAVHGLSMQSCGGERSLGSEKEKPLGGSPW